MKPTADLLREVQTVIQEVIDRYPDFVRAPAGERHIQDTFSRLKRIVGAALIANVDPAHQILKKVLEASQIVDALRGQASEESARMEIARQALAALRELQNFLLTGSGLPSPALATAWRALAILLGVRETGAEPAADEIFMPILFEPTHATEWRAPAGIGLPDYQRILLEAVPAFQAALADGALTDARYQLVRLENKNVVKSSALPIELAIAVMDILLHGQGAASPEAARTRMLEAVRLTIDKLNANGTGSGAVGNVLLSRLFHAVATSTFQNRRIQNLVERFALGDFLREASRNHVVAKKFTNAMQLLRETWITAKTAGSVRAVLRHVNEIARRASEFGNPEFTQLAELLDRYVREADQNGLGEHFWVNGAMAISAMTDLVTGALDSQGARLIIDEVSARMDDADRSGAITTAGATTRAALMAMAKELKKDIVAIEELMVTMLSGNQKANTSALFKSLSFLAGGFSLAGKKNACAVAGVCLGLAQGVIEGSEKPERFARLMASLALFVDALATDPGTSDAELAKWLPKTVAAEVADGADEDAPNNADILMVFVEECQEMIAGYEALDVQARAAVAAAETEGVVPLRRFFHTLKGSANMVGLTHMADVAFVVQEVMDLWIDAGAPTAAAEIIFDFCRRVRTAEEGWLQQIIETGRTQVSPALAEEGRALAIRLREQSVAGELSGSRREPDPLGVAADENLFGDEVTAVTGMPQPVAPAEPADPMAAAVAAEEPAPVAMGDAAPFGGGAIESGSRREPEVAPLPLTLAAEEDVPASVEAEPAVESAMVIPAEAAEEEVLAPPQDDLDIFAADDEFGTPPAALAEDSDGYRRLILAGHPSETDVPEMDIWDDMKSEVDTLLPLCNGLLDRIVTGGQASLDETHEFRRYVHTIKGSVRMAGLLSAGHILHALETAVERDCSTRTLGPVLAVVAREALDEVAGIIEQAAGSTPSDAPAAVSATTPAAAPAMETTGTTEAAGSRREPAEPATLATSVMSAKPAPNTTPRASLRIAAELAEGLERASSEAVILRSRGAEGLETLKGATLDLSANIERLATLARTLEIEADIGITALQDSRNHGGHFDPLELDRHNRFNDIARAITEQLRDLRSTSQTLASSLRDMADIDAAGLSIIQDVHADIARVLVAPFSTQQERFRRTVKKSAAEVGKQVELTFQGDIDAPAAILEKLTGPIEHILRNAVAHGIEVPAVRAATSKPQQGSIVLTVMPDDTGFLLVVRDDGAGINGERVLARAIERKLVDPSAQHSFAQICEFLFLPGFSTAEAVTQLAGRGVGLDVVRNALHEIGGRIEIRSEPGHFTEFRISVPSDISTMPVMPMTAGGYDFLVPAQIVDRIITVDQAELAPAQASGTLTIDGISYVYREMTALLGDVCHLEKSRRQRRQVFLMGTSTGIPKAFGIDSIEPFRRAVVRPVGNALAMIPGIIAASIAADGTPLLIVDPARMHVLAVEGGVGTTRRSVLVVDDSSTVRVFTRKLLSRAGYDVEEAIDGLDALDKLSKLGQSKPDVILLDLEMPRMGGFEFAGVVKRSNEYREIPIIIITSRSAQKHRDHAQTLGVQDYLCKPCNEGDLLAVIRSALARKEAGEEVATVVPVADPAA